MPDVTTQWFRCLAQARRSTHIFDGCDCGEWWQRFRISQVGYMWLPCRPMCAGNTLGNTLDKLSRIRAHAPEK